MKNKKVKKRNRFKDFFFPKDFRGEMQRGKIANDYTIVKGIAKVSEHKKGKFFLKLFMWLPIVGHFIFWMEGRKKMKTEEDSEIEQKEYVKKTNKKIKKARRKKGK